MQKSLEEQIERAKELLAVCKHAAMATVNEDGSPHNTPYLFMRDDTLERIFWGSHPDSIHSQNIRRTGQLFVVLYEADKRGGLFIRAGEGHITEGEELIRALAVHNKLRLDRGQAALPLGYYTNSPQRMWSAEIMQLWVNATKRDAHGLIMQDIRTEVTASDLLD